MREDAVAEEAADLAGLAEIGLRREDAQALQALVALARESSSWPKVNEALAVAHTGPIAVRDAQVALLESGAPVRLRSLISDTLDRVRTASREPALPAAVGSLLRDLADGVEGRIP